MMQGARGIIRKSDDHLGSFRENPRYRLGTAGIPALPHSQGVR